MKQHRNKTAGKTLIYAFFLLLISASVNVASAQFNNSNPVNLRVKYMGENNGQPVYSIQFDNQDKQVQGFFLKDADGSELYSENISGTSYSKKFQLNLPDVSTTRVVITLVDGTGRENNYVINHKVTTVDDVEVIKL
ncbi:MAG: hypothetical protein ACM3VS_13230 [Candidatus Dadabacteria bacterium]